MKVEQTLEKLAEAKSAIASLLKVDEKVQTEPIEEGKWSIREIVAHLYYWDSFNVTWMVPKMNERGTLPAFPNHDSHNREGIDLLKDKRMNDILTLFIQTREQLINELSKVDQDATFTIGKGKRRFTAKSFAAIFLKHDAHHLSQIEDYLLKKTSHK